MVGMECDTEVEEMKGRKRMFQAPVAARDATLDVNEEGAICKEHRNLKRETE